MPNTLQDLANKNIQSSTFCLCQIAWMCAKATRLRLISFALMPQSKLCWNFSLAAKITSASAECQALGGEAVNGDRKQTVVNKGHSGEWAPPAVLIIGGLYTGPIPAAAGCPQRGQQPSLAHLITLPLLWRWWLNASRINQLWFLQSRWLQVMHPSLGARELASSSG